MASGDTKTEAMLNILGNGGSGDEFRGCCNTKTQQYILDAIDRVQNVEDEVEELKNNPDVVDIVDTYADLQAYDTQHLTENDIIRVLQDETHSGNSTYYRFTKNPDTWTFIGEISGGGGGSSYTAGDGIVIENGTISADLVQYGGSSRTQIMSQRAVTDLVSGSHSIVDINYTMQPNFPEDNPDGYIVGDTFASNVIYLADENGVKLYYSETNYIEFSGYFQNSVAEINFDTEPLETTYGFVITKLNGASNTPEIYIGQTKVTEEYFDPELEEDIPRSYTSLSYEQLGSGGSAIKELTSADYNYPASNPNRVSLWRLPNGVYTLNQSISVYAGDVGFNSNQRMDKGNYAVITSEDSSKVVYIYKSGSASFVGKTSNGNSWTSYLLPSNVADNLTSSSTSSALSANQGRVLNNKIGDLSTLTTTDKTSAVAAINELAQSGGGGGSSAIELTENSFNANSNNWNDTDPANFNCVAMWLLPFGNYYVNNGSRSEGNKIPVYISKSTSSFDASYTYSYYILVPQPQQSDERYVYCYGSGGSSDSYGQQFIRCYDVYSNGTMSGSPDSVVTKNYISDFITTGDLYATPTPSDGGTVGRFYRFNNNGAWELWVCLDDDGGTGNSFTWKQVNLT